MSHTRYARAAQCVLTLLLCETQEHITCIIMYSCLMKEGRKDKGQCYVEFTKNNFFKYLKSQDNGLCIEDFYRSRTKSTDIEGPTWWCINKTLHEHN